MKLLKLTDVKNVSCVRIIETVSERKDIGTRPTEAICILQQASCRLWFSWMQIWTLKIQFMLWGPGILICYRTTTNANPPNLTLPPPCCTKPLACSFECRLTHWNNSKKWRQDLQHCLLAVTVREVARPRFRLSIVKYFVFFRPPLSSPYVVERFYFLSSFFTFLVACCDSEVDRGVERKEWWLSNLFSFVRSCSLKYKVNTQIISSTFKIYSVMQF